MIEFVPPDRRTFRSETWIANQIPVIKEKINIGKTEFEKTPEGWQKKEVSEGEIKPLREDIFKERVNRDAKWFVTENVQYEDKLADLYECVWVTKYKFKRFESEPEIEYEISFKQKFWITKDNLLLKSEAIQNNSKPGEINAYHVFTYVYDPNIKIESPLVNKEPRREPK